MALRMNLMGVDLDAIKNVFGSNDDRILAVASEHASEMLSDDKAQRLAIAWATTLVQKGGLERTAPTTPDDGGLHVYLAESETHVFALHALVKAVCGDSALDLAGESSDYHYGAFPGLIDDLRACRFSTSESCSREFLQTYSNLYRGTPMFGHKFESDWSFYSIVPREKVGFLLDGFAAAKQYEREISDPEMKAKVRTRVSEAGIQFISDIEGWFRRIKDANLDAYVIWW